MPASPLAYTKGAYQETLKEVLEIIRIFDKAPQILEYCNKYCTPQKAPAPAPEPASSSSQGMILFFLTAFLCLLSIISMLETNYDLFTSKREELEKATGTIQKLRRDIRKLEKIAGVELKAVEELEKKQREEREKREKEEEAEFEILEGKGDKA